MSTPTSNVNKGRRYNAGFKAKAKALGFKAKALGLAQG